MEGDGKNYTQQELNYTQTRIMRKLHSARIKPPKCKQTSKNYANKRRL